MVNETAGIIAYIESLRKDFDVGMVLFGEENFGSDKRATERLVEYLEGSGLNWGAGATRARTVTEEAAPRWRQAGCVHLGSGLETGSQKMLDVMEKNTTVQQNLDYLRRCSKNGIFSVLGTIIGMPGETEGTLQESIANLGSALPDHIDMPFEMYVNWLQAIPGTPLYEYARRQNRLGMSLDEEEKYIESLYDHNANEFDHYLNYTDQAKEEIAYWRLYFMGEMLVAYVRKHGVRNIFLKYRTKKFKYALVYGLVPRPVRRTLLKYFVMLKEYGLARSVRTVYRAWLRRAAKTRFATVSTSLRQVNKTIPLMVREDDLSTAILREGR